MVFIGTFRALQPCTTASSPSRPAHGLPPFLMPGRSMNSGPTMPSEQDWKGEWASPSPAIVSPLMVPSWGSGTSKQVWACRSLRPPKAGWVEGSTPSGWSINVGCRAIAPANLTARNESPTPGAFLADITLHQTTALGRLSLEVQNAFNREWLDHTSAYRALGLVAQGRWVQRIHEDVESINPRTSITMNIQLNSAAACLLLAAALTSCDNTDTEAPTVCTEAGAMNSVLADEVEAEAETTSISKICFATTKIEPSSVGHPQRGRSRARGRGRG